MSAREAEAFWRLVYRNWSPVERQRLYRIATFGGWPLRPL